MKKSMPGIKPLTPEEKTENALRFLTQKRESFLQGILFNLCTGKGAITKEEGETICDRAVEMSEYLITKLYTIKED